MRKRQDISDVKMKIDVHNLHELRDSEAGKLALAKMGRKPRHGRLGNFVAWDGEGIGNTPQKYVLFGCSTGEYVQAENLTTFQCLNLMLQVEYNHPNSIHVGFAFNYDVNMILADTPQPVLRALYDNTVARWKQYRLEYIPGKYFQVSGKVNGKTVCAKIWDIFSFFQCSFVMALTQYLGDIPDIKQIEGGKKKRGDFQYDELESLIKPYWQLELKYLVDLANRLRSILYEAGIRITLWQGPGSIANYLFRRNHVKPHMSQEIPEAVLAASQYAFAAGRFRAA
jgi:hypothetical protein